MCYNTYIDSNNASITHRGLKMATLITQKTCFTADFAKLSDARKIEEIMAQLHKIACYHDIDDSFAYNEIMENLNEFRKVVK